MISDLPCHTPLTDYDLYNSHCSPPSMLTCQILHVAEMFLWMTTRLVRQSGIRPIFGFGGPIAMASPAFNRWLIAKSGSLAVQKSKESTILINNGAPQHDLPFCQVATQATKTSSSNVSGTRLTNHTQHRSQQFKTTFLPAETMDCVFLNLNDTTFSSQGITDTLIRSNKRIACLP